MRRQSLVLFGRKLTAVEPENRLVAREVEKRWEATLNEKSLLEQEYARHRQTQAPKLSEQERHSIQALSENLPLVWNSESTTTMDRQRIVRFLLDRVTVNIQGKSDQVDITLDWAGGFTSQHEIIRPVQRYDQLANYDQLISRIEELRASGADFAKIADDLNREGFRPANQAKKFHADLVSALMRRHYKKIPSPHSNPHREALQENEWFLFDLARELGMPKNTAFAWKKRGWIRVLRRLPGYRGRLVCWADSNDLARLRKLRDTKHGWWDPTLPPDLTTPGSPGEQE